MAPGTLTAISTVLLRNHAETQTLLNVGTALLSSKCCVSASLHEVLHFAIDCPHEMYQLT